jgi:Transcription factor WhiB
VEGPVLIECKAFAVIVHPEYGIWSGTTEKERRAIRRSLLLVVLLAVEPPGDLLELGGKRQRERDQARQFTDLLTCARAYRVGGGGRGWPG